MTCPRPGSCRWGAPGLGWVALAPFAPLGQAQDFATIKVLSEIPSWPQFLLVPLSPWGGGAQVGINPLF